MLGKDAREQTSRIFPMVLKFQISPKFVRSDRSNPGFLRRVK